MPARRGGRRGEAGAPHAREIHPAALEQCAFLEHAREAAAALGAGPGIAAEPAAVERFECGDDARLQLREVVAERFEVHFFNARWPMSLRYCMPSKRIASTVS